MGIEELFLYEFRLNDCLGAEFIACRCQSA